NCSAHFRGNECEIWAPTQVPQDCRDTVAPLLGLKPERVKVNITLLGGGFGRRLDRKSTRLNSSHRTISYAVFCLKKKKNRTTDPNLNRSCYPPITRSLNRHSMLPNFNIYRT